MSAQPPGDGSGESLAAGATANSPANRPEADAAEAPRLADRVPDGRLYDPEVILDRFLKWTADVSLDLYPAQEEALLELSTGQHVILSTPTGSGKSLVALGLHF